MNVRALAIYLGKTLRVGTLLQYEMPQAETTTRFVADDAFARMRSAPVLSARFLAPSPEAQAAFWTASRSPLFNGRHSMHNGSLLPAFFQNLLPEGVFRDHVAELRGCDPNDHFEILAACGRDLPGNVKALPVELSRDQLSRLIPQDNDTLEMSVTAQPLEDGVSLSGVQPKLAVIRRGDRYVGRTRRGDTHIIAKLPVIGQARLPEVEELSLRLASAAGVNACAASLEPLKKLAVEHGYDLGDADGDTHFLAVPRYDRTPRSRIHAEDFAQALGVMPEDKYRGGSYLDVATVMMAFASLGEPAVHELLRRIAVNELLGNPDMHLKNIGLWYPDGVTPQLPPAYDIVAYAAFTRRIGHALRILPDETGTSTHSRAVARKAVDAVVGRREKPRLTALVLHDFCNVLGISQKPATTVVRQCVAAAHRSWPSLIEQSLLTELQRGKLTAYFRSHPWIEALDARRALKEGPGAP